MKSLEKMAWDLPKRFWQKVASSKDVTECWLWLGNKDKYGYGRLGWLRGAMGITRGHIRAPTLSYWLNKGRMPKGIVIMHTCDNPSCVNPNHLIAGTHSQNFKDAAIKGRLGRNIYSSIPFNKVIQAKSMYVNSQTIRQISAALKISPSTAWRYIAGKSRYRGY